MSFSGRVEDDGARSESSSPSLHAFMGIYALAPRAVGNRRWPFSGDGDGGRRTGSESDSDDSSSSSLRGVRWTLLSRSLRGEFLGEVCFSDRRGDLWTAVDFDGRVSDEDEDTAERVRVCAREGDCEDEPAPGVNKSSSMSLGRDSDGLLRG